MIESKTVIITGAASGFGYEITRRFAQDPKYDPVYAIDKDPQVHRRFPPDTFERIKAIELDVRDTCRTATLVDQIIAERGGIDVLVNNAGIMISGRAHTFFDESGRPTEDLRAMWETNLRAPLVIQTQTCGRSGTEPVDVVYPLSCVVG